MTFIKLNNKLISLGGNFLSIPGFDPYATSLINRMILTGETPTIQRQTLINNTIVSARSKPFWNKLDALWCLAGHSVESSKLNWINSNHTCTTINSPTFTIDRGFTTNGVNNYINTNYNPYSNKVNLSLNSTSMGFYGRIITEQGNMYDMGCAESLSPVSYLLLTSRVSSHAVCYVYTNGINYVFPSNSTVSLVICNRVNSTTQSLYLSTNKTSTNYSPIRIPNLNIYLGCFNYDLIIQQPKINQYAFSFVGGGLTDQDVADMNSVFVDGYLNSIGAKI